jgi:rhodanese-related sulfurtransferase
MRTSSTALLLASLLAFGSGCAASTTTPTGTGQPSEQPGGGTPPAGDEASDPPAAETPAACADAPAGTVADVSVSDLKGLLDKGAKLAVVDVREPDETAQGTIDGALLFPWTSKVLQARHGELPTDRPIYVVCRSGSRSSQASAFLAKNGHACIHDVQGGMNAWAAASYPTTK